MLMAGGEDMVVNVKVMNYAHSKFSFPAPTSKWYLTIPRSILL